MLSNKPLFIPLQKKWFNEFLEGRKETEYRLYGPRWNEYTCYIGRKVTLSCGYSGDRLSGIIKNFGILPSGWLPDAEEIYGPLKPIACIAISLD